MSVYAGDKKIKVRGTMKSGRVTCDMRSVGINEEVRGGKMTRNIRTFSFSLFVP